MELCHAKTHSQTFCNRASSYNPFPTLTSGFAADFKREVIYQIITDRFFDGNTANNNRRKAPDCMTQRRQTGDFTGAATCKAFSKRCPTSPAWGHGDMDLSTR